MHEVAYCLLRDAITLHNQSGQAPLLQDSESLTMARLQKLNKNVFRAFQDKVIDRSEASIASIIRSVGENDDPDFDSGDEGEVEPMEL